MSITVDERNARNKKERAGGYRHLGRTVEAQCRRGAERSQKGGKDKNQEVIHGMRLHPLPGGKTDERRGEDDAHGRPVPAEQTTKGGIRQADRQQDENRVHTRLGDQLSVTVAQVGQRQVFIDGIPTQSAQIEFRSKLIGSAGIFTTRVTTSPLRSSCTVMIMLF